MDYIQRVVYKNTIYPYEKERRRNIPFLYRNWTNQADCYKHFKTNQIFQRELDDPINFSNLMKYCCGSILYETNSNNKVKLFLNRQENLTLINDLKDYCKITSGKDKFKFQFKLEIDWFSHSNVIDNYSPTISHINFRDDDLKMKLKCKSIVIPPKDLDNKSLEFLSNTEIKNDRDIFYNYCESIPLK